jgi:inner membrane protein
VYTAKVTLDGTWPKLDLAALGIDNAVPLDRVEVLMRLSDPHALETLPIVEISGVEHPFEPAAENFGEAGNLHVALPHAPAPGSAFTIALDLRGSSGLYFAPLGGQTQVTLAANWPHPSFQGGWLPKQHAVDDSGFSAAWSIPYIARGFPSMWKQGDVSDKTLGASHFGVELITPVDPYRMSQRSLKYAALFIGLTFLALWLFEVRTGLRVHTVQYLLVGAGMCMFYLLELSLAEQVGFVIAYVIASGAIVMQLALYSRAVLKAWPRALMMGGLISLLYGLLYVLLRDEDYALLIGSSGLFLALSAVMYLTRGVQWSPQSAKAAPL